MYKCMLYKCVLCIIKCTSLDYNCHCYYNTATTVNTSIFTALHLNSRSIVTITATATMTSMITGTTPSSDSSAFTILWAVVTTCTNAATASMITTTAITSGGCRGHSNRENKAWEHFWEKRGWSACSSHFLPWDRLYVKTLKPTPPQALIFLLQILIDQDDRTGANRPKAVTYQAVGCKELIVRLQDTAPDIIYTSTAFKFPQGAAHLHFWGVCVGISPRNRLSFKACLQSKLRNNFSVMACCSLE